MLLTQKKDVEVAIITLNIAANIVYFDGHFSEISILPSVVQVHWAIYFARTLFDMLSELEGIDSIKFQNTILPCSQSSLLLRYREDKRQLLFSYKTIDKIHASGRIIFGDKK